MTDKPYLRYRFEEYCVCPQGQLAKAHDEANIGPLLQQRRDSAWAKSGVPVRLRDCRLATSPQIGIAAAMAKDRGSWYLHGLPSVGKSGLAVGYLWQWLQDDRGDASFLTVPDLFMGLRGTYNAPAGYPTETEVIKNYRDIPLLVLDDLGAEKVTEDNRAWVEDRLMLVIGHRHAANLTTVITANISLRDVTDRVGERLGYRILEMCGPGHVQEVRGPNLRDPT